MRRVIQAIVVSSMIAFPAFAQDAGMAASMTCAEFVAMNSDGQMMAVEEMQMAAEEMATDKMMPEDGMAPEDSMKAEGGMAPEDSMKAEGGMATEDSMKAEDGMAPEDSMKAEDGMTDEGAMMVAAILEACEGHPDMMAMDAMMEASGK